MIYRLFALRLKNLRTYIFWDKDKPKLQYTVLIFFNYTLRFRFVNVRADLAAASFPFPSQAGDQRKSVPVGLINLVSCYYTSYRYYDSILDQKISLPVTQPEK